MCDCNTHTKLHTHVHHTVSPALVTILSLDIMVLLLSREHLYDRMTHILTWYCSSAIELMLRVSFLVAVLSAVLSADNVTMARTTDT